MSELASSDQALTAAYDSLRSDAVFIDFDQFESLTLTGDDRKGWLQGQVTNDLRSFDAGAYRAFCLCEITGHLRAVVDGWALTDRIILTTDRETMTALRSRVDQMVILEDVVVEQPEVLFRMLCFQGPSATRRLGEKLTLPTLDAGPSRVGDVEVFCLRSDRTGSGGWDILVPETAFEAIESLTSGFARASASTWDLARIEAGIPRWNLDMGSKTLPPELGPAFEAKHISYNKGCYMGQEVLMRLHSRGHTNRTWMGLRSEVAMSAGAELLHRGRPGVGVITSCAESPDYGFIAMAMLRNEVALDGEILQFESASGRAEAEVCRLPFLRLD